MLTDAIRYPLRGRDAAGTVFIGGFLHLFGWGLVAGSVGLVHVFATTVADLAVVSLVLPLVAAPWLPVLGHGVAVLRATIDGAAEPPRFEDWERLAVDGLRATVVVAAYALPLAALGLPAALVAGAEHVGEGTVPGVDLPLALGTAAGGYGLVASYALPLSLCSMAHGGRFGAAFDRDRLLAAAGRPEYAAAWLLALVALLVGNNVAGGLTVVLVGFFGLFYLQVLALRLYGVGYARAMTAGQ